MKIKHPMPLIIPDDFNIERNPFDVFMENRSPVVGRDLKVLASKLSLSVIDSSWFYGLTVAAWYEYTKDPTEKVRAKYRKKIKQLESQRQDVVNMIHNSRDKALKLELENLDTKIETLEQDCRDDCAKIEKDELKACMPRRRRVSTQLVDNSPAKKPGNAVELPLALLVRITSQMPFLTQSLPLSSPDIEVFSELMTPYTDKDFSFYLGRDENATYRWEKGINPPSTAVKRLIHLLSLWFLMEPVKRKGQRIQWWIEFVDQERQVLKNWTIDLPKRELSKYADSPGL